MWQLVVGILVAVAGISIIPWVTSAATLWIEQRRGDRQRRRDLYAQWTLAHLHAASPGPGGTTKTNNELNDAAWLLDAQFGPRDAEIRKAVPKSYSGLMNDEQKEIFRWWALGYHRAARRAARKFNRASGSTS